MTSKFRVSVRSGAGFVTVELPPLTALRVVSALLDAPTHPNTPQANLWTMTGIGHTLGVPVPVVNAIARRYGYPSRDRLQIALRTLTRQVSA